MEFHEVANIFPLMQSDEFAALVADINVHGLREPIWLYQDKIIDGRNRYQACGQAGIEPQYREYTGDEAGLLSFVLSLNLQRRHLTSSQKAMLAVEVEKYLAKDAEEKERLRKTTFQKIEKSSLAPVHAAKQAAALVGTNHQYVVDAKKIAERAPDLTEAVRSGSLNIPDAKVVSKLPEDQRQDILAKLGTASASEGTTTKAYDVIQEVKREGYRKVHEDREEKFRQGVLLTFT